MWDGGSRFYCIFINAVWIADVDSFQRPFFAPSGQWQAFTSSYFPCSALFTHLATHRSSGFLIGQVRSHFQTLQVAVAIAQTDSCPHTKTFSTTVAETYRPQP